MLFGLEYIILYIDNVSNKAAILIFHFFSPAFINHWPSLFQLFYLIKKRL